MHRYMLCVSCFAAVNANFENKVAYAQKHMPERRRNKGWKECVFRQPKKHMAYRKKYKAHILKEVPGILKYMACIFRLSKCLINNNLQKLFKMP